MNSLSWLLYLAQVSEGLGALATTLAIICTLALLPVLMITGIRWEEAPREKEAMVLRRGMSWGTRLVLTAIFCAAVAVVLPTKNTLYAIAASEVGEKAIQSEAVRGVADESLIALRAWLRKQSEPKKKD